MYVTINVYTHIATYTDSQHNTDSNMPQRKQNSIYQQILLMELNKTNSQQVCIKHSPKTTE